MKKTKGQIACILGQFIAMFVVPIVIMWLEYGDSAFVVLKYKLSISGIVFVLFFFLISKKFWLDDSLKRMEQKIINIETDALQLTDSNAIATTKRAYKRYRLIDLIMKSIMPVALLAVFVFIIKGVEQQAFKMYSVLLWSSVSFMVGIILKVLEITLIRFIHE